MAVASSSSRAMFELKTVRHRDWFSRFASIVLGDDARIRHGKPAPDLFLVAAAAMGASPASCVVVEDAPAGVEAARNAGMAVIAVPDPGMSRSRFAGADLIVSGLGDIDVERLLS